MFLTNEEIIELTGYKKSKYQINWLNQNGIKYLVGYDGKPRVMISQIESLIGSAIQKTKRRNEPNEEALNKYMGLA